MGGGGEAGGSKRGGDLKFVRHVPKFLQAHAHLLDKSLANQEEPTMVGGDLSEEEEPADDDEDALRRAIEQDPSLLQQHPELQGVADKAAAAQEKEKGNKAFAGGDFETAVKHFTRCIELDPRNEVYYSNRAAALTSLQRYAEAVRDAKRVVELKPRWAKGYARLGAAHFGLEEYSEAREAYEVAAKLEPDDQHVQNALQKARNFEARQEAEHKHKFKRKHDAGGGGGGSQQQQRGKDGDKKRKALLSFDDDNEGS
ncbi:hypothetical protein N2152v2_005932 [Parachlorella kessleri]